MSAERMVTEEMVEQLAKLAELEVEPDRRALVAAQLDALLTAANGVNRFMDGRREAGPAVRFDHPELRRDDDR
jgi:Asp-tRNA(Asn)/Glu-tRNA(Gln) amidotransferase C subunit